MTKEKQFKIDQLYLRMASIWAKNSYAIRRQVGCLIVKNNSIISDGYNGTPTGFPNVCEYPVDNYIKNSILKNTPSEEAKRELLCNLYRKDKNSIVTCDNVLHAESNAIAKLAKSNNSSEGATLYVTDEPCLNCAKLIIQAGITRVVYHKEYRTHQGLELLKEAGIKCVQLSYLGND